MADATRETFIFPEEPFEDFYKSEEYVRDLLERPEWEGMYKHFYTISEDELDIPTHETVQDLEAFTPEQQAEEIVKCGLSFEYFCHRYVKILHALHGTIPFLMYNYQHTVIKEFNDNKFNIISKFRQGGLTTVAVLWGLWQSIFHKDQNILVLSITDREAITAGEIAQRAIDNMPVWLYQDEENKATLSKHEKVFPTTGSKITFHTPKAARGKTATMIIIDEAAFIPNMHEHWKGMYPVISTGGKVNVISTVNGLGNWYQEIYYEAEAGDNFFNVIDLDYWEHPQYANPDWAKRTEANIGKLAWKQEILRSFLGSGNTYFSMEIVSELDKVTRDIGYVRAAFPKWVNVNDETRAKFDWGEGSLWIWKEPIDDHEYIIGVDCAEGIGQKGDNSAFQIIDAGTLEQVAEFYSNTIPPNVLSKILSQIGIYYNTALIVVENASIGGAVLNALQHDLAYDNLYYEEKNIRAGRPGIKPNTQNRSLLLEGLQNRLLNGTIRINSRRLVHEFKTFRFNAQRKRAEAEVGRHDDAIFAMCYALYVRDTNMRDLPVGADIPDEMMKVFKSEAYEEIKAEILKGSPDDWIDRSNKEDMFDPLYYREEDGLPPIDFNIKRKYNKILREFGW
ncbi:MAG: phage terminase large subunit family protein [Candidatus Thorarchaeota archaeon]|jgi:hypothetical protein